MHYTELLVDAIYYNLSRLASQLRANYVVNVGGKVFRIEKEVLEKRDAPNFFTTLGFGHSWEPPSGLPLMPIPPALPPPMLDRDPELFSDILRYLQGYEIGIRDEVQRQNLLKDARFYHLKGLTEKLLASRVTTNGFANNESVRHEILFRLRDIRPASVILPETTERLDEELTAVMYKNKEGAVYALLVEAHDLNLVCRYSVSSTPATSAPIHPLLELAFCEKDRQKLKDIAKSIKASEEIAFTVRSPESCAFEIDGSKTTSDALAKFDRLAALLKSDDTGSYLQLYVTKCIVRLFVLRGKVELELVKCEAFSTERGLNVKREFLPAETRIAL